MSISSMSSASSLNLASNTAFAKPKSAVDVAASLFGMSKGHLVAELKSGKSLNDVAAENGVSTDDLDSALVENMPKSLAASGDPTEIAQKIAAQVGLRSPGGPDGPPPPDSTGASSASSSASPAGTSVLESLAKLLGTDTASLKDSLSSGTTLSDLLSQSGVSTSAVADALQPGLLLDTSA